MDESIEDAQNSSQDLSETSQRSTRERKHCYRELLNKVEGLRESEAMGVQAVTQLGEILREVNVLDEECSIEDRVGNADETLLDCLVLSSASNILKKCIDAVDVFTSTYDSTDFANKLISQVMGKNDEGEFEAEDLLKLIEDARDIVPEVPKLGCVYGTYDLDVVPQPKVKKPRTKVVKEQFQKKEPEKIVSLDKEEEGIEEIVKVLYDVLNAEYTKNREKPIPYYDYVIDTESFSNTVENMFYFSFLIRDGRAQIDLDSKGRPIIKPVKKSDLKRFRDNNGKNSQMISNINMEEWKKYKMPGFIQTYKTHKQNGRK